jgi:hypothetical protein
MLCGNRALRDRKLRQIAQSHAMTSIVRNTARGKFTRMRIPITICKVYGLSLCLRFPSCPYRKLKTADRDRESVDTRCRGATFAG